ncbi:Sensor histidine kinase YehU [Kordia antarctica]|uniref:Sensor histidine kinase YehU n=1 Tax=Kordia antarctica TaxID=1218801 RepID=A0A7L4ZKN7_9FLAO|nr:histidine kinase [Kordia antarctica]QHI37071.1 Sensor histidine kinase YehU [Kordia antarctica]
MATSTKINTYTFWILQFLGWGFLTTANVWSKILIVPEEKSKAIYFFFEGLIFMFLAITLTTLFRNYLKRIDFIANQNSKNYGKAFVAYALIVLTFIVILIVSAHYMFIYINEKSAEISTLEIFLTGLNVSVFIFLWTIFYVGVKSLARLRKNKIDRLKLETALKDSQLNTLKGQLNPHFMFNSLNNIRGLMLEDVEKSREMLTRLSDMLRYSLNMDKVDAIQIEQELEIVDNYVALSKIQLEDRLQYSKQVDANLLQIKIPPMVLQMLVENAIKHGISNQKNGGKITLIVTDNNEKIILQVNNTGTLQTDTDSTRIGLNNIKKRLELLYGNEASFTLKEVENEVHAIIQIPVN